MGDPERNLSLFAGAMLSMPGPDGALADGEVLALGPSRWLVRHTPGHSPGGVSLILLDAIGAPAGQALVGDTLFAGSIGRSDFPGSDPDVLADSIRRVLYALPDATVIHPGHGPTSTIGREKRTNPFVRA
jgi:glyoxylase-like metal-dependent hydrolase (beta-lactamase superfamily II)